MPSPLFSEFSKKIISNEAVGQMAADRIAGKYKLTEEYCKKNFSSLLAATEAEAYRIYLEKEKEAGEDVISKFVTARGSKGIFTELDRFFLSLSQSRKSRAGKAFEEIIKSLFRKCGYPFEEQCIINGKPDFLMPSEEHYHRNAPDCIIFTAKRTLRERWRQIATEGVRGLGFFLGTIDEKVTTEQISEMLRNRIYLVVPVLVKESVKQYTKAPNVISFEDFFSDYVDVAVKRWKKSGVLTK